MSAYHNREAFDARMRRRRENPVPLKGPKVFWHVGCINHWREVADEQLRLLAHLGLTRVTACVLGTAADVVYLVREASAKGVFLEMPFTSPDLGLWEGPTIREAWRFSHGNQDHAVLYFHTKGVTAPGDPQKRQWRWVMQKEVLGEWRRNMGILQVADMCGVSWQELKDFPHFSGNFWMARCDWLAHLQDPAEYRKRHPNRSWASHSWNDRMYTETWLGSEQWHHIESFCCRNGHLWGGQQVFKFSIEIPGFRYGHYLD